VIIQSRTAAETGATSAREIMISAKLASQKNERYERMKHLSIS